MHVFLFGLAFPLGWIEPPTYESLLGLLQSPVTRLYLLVLCVLSLFHWAHRFRNALYDGAQIRHLNEVIVVATYGGALAGSVGAAYVLFLACVIGGDRSPSDVDDLDELFDGGCRLLQRPHLRPVLGRSARCPPARSRRACTERRRAGPGCRTRP